MSCSFSDVLHFRVDVGCVVANTRVGNSVYDGMSCTSPSCSSSSKSFRFTAGQAMFCQYAEEYDELELGGLMRTPERALFSCLVALIHACVS